MPSPFPGMNPYLEQSDMWTDFHSRFLNRLADMLGAATAPKYFVKVEANLYIHEFAGEERRLFARADVSVGHTGQHGAATSGGILTAPLYLQLPEVEIEEQIYLEIHNRSRRKIVTVIELLSPANKAKGPDREQYLLKRKRLLATDVNLVEIDLLRGGARPQQEGLPRCEYLIMVSRVMERPNLGYWPIALRDRLPAVPIPLAEGDADVLLDLQQALHAVYDAAHYETYVYENNPEPALSPPDAAWAQSLIPATA